MAEREELEDRLIEETGAEPWTIYTGEEAKRLWERLKKVETQS